MHIFVFYLLFFNRILYSWTCENRRILKPKIYPSFPAVMTNLNFTTVQPYSSLLELKFSTLGQFCPFANKTHIPIEYTRFPLRPVPHISLTRLGDSMELGKPSHNKVTYVIKTFTAKDAGKYVCRTRNDYGDTSESTTSVTMLGESRLLGLLVDNKI